MSDPKFGDDPNAGKNRLAPGIKTTPLSREDRSRNFSTHGDKTASIHETRGASKNRTYRDQQTGLANPFADDLGKKPPATKRTQQTRSDQYSSFGNRHAGVTRVPLHNNVHDGARSDGAGDSTA